MFFLSGVSAEVVELILSLLVNREIVSTYLLLIMLHVHNSFTLIGAFCRIEVDSYGHFLTKAKTTVVGPSREPVWTEVCVKIVIS